MPENSSKHSLPVQSVLSKAQYAQACLSVSFIFLFGKQGIGLFCLVGSDLLSKHVNPGKRRNNANAMDVNQENNQRSMLDFFKVLALLVQRKLFC